MRNAAAALPFTVNTQTQKQTVNKNTTHKKCRRVGCTFTSLFSGGMKIPDDTVGSRPLQLSSNGMRGLPCNIARDLREAFGPQCDRSRTVWFFSTCTRCSSIAVARLNAEKFKCHMRTHAQTHQPKCTCSLVSTRF